MAPSNRFMCLDLRRCALLCWSCARARALQQQTQVTWEPYRESKALNALYGVLFWKEGPGIVEVRQDRQKIDLLTEQYFNQTFDAFLERSFLHGPLGLVPFVRGLTSIRDYALESVQERFREASSINEAVREEAHKTVQTLARIKLGSALVLTGAGCYLALAGASVVLVTQVGLVKLGSDVAGEMIKGDEHIDSGVKGIAYQVSKYGAEHGSDKLAEHAEQIGEHASKLYSAKLMSAEQRVERYSAELARRFRSRKVVKVGRRLNHAERDVALAGRSLKSAENVVKTAKLAGKAVPIVFAAWDVMDAWKDYNEDTEE